MTIGIGETGWKDEPGSVQARKQGCRGCVAAFTGYPYDDDHQPYIAPECPIHGHRAKVHEEKS